MANTPDGEKLRDPAPSVQRIMWAGTIWFVLAIVTATVPTAILLASNWRPGLLPLPLQVLWWLGAAGVAISLPLIGWSGCPVLSTRIVAENARKARTIALGTGIFIGGVVVAGLALLLSPPIG